MEVRPERGVRPEAQLAPRVRSGRPVLIQRLTGSVDVTPEHRTTGQGPPIGAGWTAVGRRAGPRPPDVVTSGP